MHLHIDSDPVTAPTTTLDANRVLTKERSLLLDEAGLHAAFDAVPWADLVFLKCERSPDGKRLLTYTWRSKD